MLWIFIDNIDSVYIANMCLPRGERRLWFICCSSFLANRASIETSNQNRIHYILFTEPEMHAWPDCLSAGLFLLYSSAYRYTWFETIGGNITDCVSMLDRWPTNRLFSPSLNTPQRFTGNTLLWQRAVGSYRPCCPPRCRLQLSADRRDHRWSQAIVNCLLSSESSGCRVCMWLVAE